MEDLQKRRDLLKDYRFFLKNLDKNEKNERDLYLKQLADGKIIGAQTGYPSIDKPWLKWYRKEFINLPVKEMTAYEYFLKSTESFPNAYLINYYGRKFTRNDIKYEVEENMKRFSAMGLKEGDVVSLIMLNVPEAIFLFYALMQMGITANMIKFDESSERIKYMTELTNSKYLFASAVPFIIENVNGALKNNKSLKKVFVADLTQSLPLGSQFKMLYDQLEISRKIKQSTSQEKINSIEYMAIEFKKQMQALKVSKQNLQTLIQNNPKFELFNNWLKTAKNYKLNKNNKNLAHHTATIVYTGGTTGNPKGVKLTNHNLNSMAHALKYGEYNFDLGKTSVNILPPAIAYYFNAIHGNISLGVEVSLISHFTPEEYPYIIKKYHPNIFMSGPILLENIRKADILKDTSFMIAPISGGDKLQESEEISFNNYLKKYGSKTTVHQGYGMSEGSAASTYSKDNAYKLGSVGIPFINLTVSIFEYKTDNELTYNNVGEICITGDTIMRGYFDNDEATNQVLMKHKDGKIWLHTDDLGFMDNEGHVFHRGRAKRMLTRSGEKVWLTEIENLASSHPNIEKCSCVKLNDSIEREVPILHIVLKESDNLENLIDELNILIEKKLNKIYVPKYYIIRSELPYSEVNKKCDFKKLESENIFDENEYTINGQIIVKNGAYTLKKRYNKKL